MILRQHHQMSVYSWTGTIIELANVVIRYQIRQGIGQQENTIKRAVIRKHGVDALMGDDFIRSYHRWKFLNLLHQQNSIVVSV